jgi:transcriptional regulator with XRE-family HTH domain
LQLVNKLFISFFMAKNNIDKKDIAQSLFLNGSYTQEEIAAKVGTTRQTVSRWVRDGAWEELKASRTITTEQLIAQYKRQLAEINKRVEARPSGERFPTIEEADAIVKTAGAIKKLEQDIGVSDCVSVAMRFLSWLRPVDADAARTFNDYFDAFIKDQAGRARK